MSRSSKMWQQLTIKNKILIFTGAVFVTCFLSVLFNIWVTKFSLVDFNRILEENTQSVALVQALEAESEYFRDFVQGVETANETTLGEVMEATKDAVYALPFDYNEIGEARYAQTWSIRNSYEVYVEKREVFLAQGKSNPSYIIDLYEIYDMQSYIQLYAKNLMTETLEEGSFQYQDKVSGLVWVPLLFIGFGCGLLAVMIEFSQLMYKTIIVPVMKLVTTAKKIADNDFFVEDVQVENQDELGELVHAFNKMKYATGEYITALEEKRKTLDLLHAEEVERLGVENQLEVIKFDLLKSQVNPHFLFNTLNVIGGMANLEDAQTTEKMIKSLSSLFRYNLKTDDMEVPLARELKVVEDYMYLQQMRFGDRISYEIICQVDEEVVLVPAFTFQPLVENAIIHGISRKEEGGKVRIRICMQEKNLLIYIGDTGNGMNGEALATLRDKLERKKSQEDVHRGIGLGNIYRRVAAMYPDGEVKIYSKENAGTVIKIVIPQKKEEKHVSSVDCG